MGTEFAPPQREAVNAAVPDHGTSRDVATTSRTLRIGAVDDPLEHDADLVADAVVTRIRRHGSGDGSPATVVRRSPSSSSADDGAVDADTHRRIQAARGGGRPLAPDNRATMESAFGTDLGAVRIHTNAADLNQRLGARAFTVGNDIFVPGSTPGNGAADQHLLAHELAHTVQHASTPRIRRKDGVTAPRRSNAAIVDEIMDARIESERAYIYEGLGGGGASWRRSDEVKNFRGSLKESGRARAYDDVEKVSDRKIRKSSGSDEGPSDAVLDYQRMIGGNVAYKKTKGSVDTALRHKADRIVDSHKALRTARHHVKKAVRKATGDEQQAIKAGQAELKKHRADIRAESTRAKDAVVGKREYKQSDRSLTDKGSRVEQRVVRQVRKDEVGRKSLEEAIEAPTMGAALRILGKLIDGIIPGAGESVNIAVEVTIPTGGPSIMIKIDGLAARGINGATTAGVITLGNPERVEVKASFSVGLGVEAIGLKLNGNAGLLVRAGSDKGTDVALQALSYGAYRAASRLSDGFGNLWAPEDQASSANKKRNKSSGDDQLTTRTKRQRAEMWAAMVESTVFDEDADAFADIGANFGGGGGLNINGVKVEASGGKTVFERFDQQSLIESLGDDVFGQRVLDDKAAKTRRREAEGTTKKARAFNLTVEANILGTTTGFSASISGANSKNWGVEITATVGTPPGVDVPVLADKIVNDWISGLGTAIKRIADLKSNDEDRSGTQQGGLFAQLALIDSTTIIDKGMEREITDAIGNISTTQVEKSVFDTALGGKAPTGEDALEKASQFAVSSGLTFAVTFGMNSGEFVIRFELRSSKSINIGGGTPVVISGNKSARLLAIGRDGEKGIVGELFGQRIDSKDG